MPQPRPFLGQALNGFIYHEALVDAEQASHSSRKWIIPYIHSVLIIFMQSKPEL